jgi:cytochrome P450
MRNYPEVARAGLFYVDVWPLLPPTLAIVDPELLAQFTQGKAMPRARLLKNIFYDFTQNLDLFTSDGGEWRSWRTRLSPGFSSRNLAAFVPAMLEEVQVFRSLLLGAAENAQVVHLEERCVYATVDIMGRVIM